MGNALRCLANEREEDHVGRDHRYPFYSEPCLMLQSGTVTGDLPAIAMPPLDHPVQVLGPHGVTAATAGVAASDQYILNYKSTSMAPVPRFGQSKRVVASQYQYNTNQDIDESSAKELLDAANYAKANAMLIQVQVLGTSKKFWRLSDEATRVSRKLALILRSHHEVSKYLAAPLHVSNVWISSAGNVKLRGVRFSFTGNNHIRIQRFRDDYKQLSRVLHELIRISGGDIRKLPPDYKEFLALLESDTLTINDEFLIVNNPALLPMSNRTEVFLMLYDRIVTYLGHTKPRRAKKKRILSNLPYKNDWLDTAKANTKIRHWVDNVQKQYNSTLLDQLRLNRNVRSHLRRSCIMSGQS